MGSCSHIWLQMKLWTESWTLGSYIWFHQFLQVNISQSVTVAGDAGWYQGGAPWLKVHHLDTTQHGLATSYWLLHNLYNLRRYVSWFAWIALTDMWYQWPIYSNHSLIRGTVEPHLLKVTPKMRAPP